MTDYLPFLIAYLLGGIPFGIIVTRLAGKGDIRSYGSGNIGATNVARVCGFKTALWVYLGDIGKAAVAVLLAKFLYYELNITLLSPDVYLVVTAGICVIGSIFPLFLKFKGGKGVNASLGAVITLMPLEALGAFAVFLIFAFLTRLISLASILGVSSFTIILLLEKYYFLRPVNTVYIILGILLACFVIIAHRKNIIRILNGSEKKFSISSKNNEAENHV